MKILQIISQVLKGGGKGIVSPITETIKAFRKLKASGAAQWLDTNGDGKITIDDIRDLQWQTLGKILAIAVALYFAEKYGILNILNQLG